MGSWKTENHFGYGFKKLNR